MVKIVSSVAELIGDTPIIKLSKVVPEGVCVNLFYAKFRNLTCSANLKLF